jgi:hypothetical protein
MGTMHWARPAIAAALGFAGLRALMEVQPTGGVLVEIVAYVLCLLLLPTVIALGVALHAPRREYLIAGAGAIAGVWLAAVVHGEPTHHGATLLVVPLVYATWWPIQALPVGAGALLADRGKRRATP